MLSYLMDTHETTLLSTNLSASTSKIANIEKTSKMKGDPNMLLKTMVRFWTNFV